MWTDANVMGALPNIGGALCSTPQSLADPAAGMSCSNAANIGERKIWTQSEFCIWPKNSVKGQQPQKYIYGAPAQETAKHHAKFGPPFPWNRHHRNSGDCLEGKRENYQVCSVQYCVQQLYRVNCTHIWTDLTVLWIGCCLTGPISLYFGFIFVYVLFCVWLYIACMCTV